MSVLLAVEIGLSGPLAMRGYCFSDNAELGIGYSDWDANIDGCGD